MLKQTKQMLFGVYLAAAIATLVFQVAVRSRECVGVDNCALGYGKAVVWSLIWPASWATYLRPSLSDWLRERGYLPKGGP